MTPAMKKFHLRTGKRESFRNHKMSYPQWNAIPGTRIKALIDESGHIIEFDLTEAVIG